MYVSKTSILILKLFPQLYNKRSFDPYFSSTGYYTERYLYDSFLNIIGENDTNSKNVYMSKDVVTFFTDFPYKSIILYS